MQAGIPVQRLGEPLDIAYAALYLASDETRSVTGTSLEPHTPLDEARSDTAPPTAVSRPLEGAPPMSDLVLGYSRTNSSLLLKTLLGKFAQLKFRVDKNSETWTSPFSC